MYTGFAESRNAEMYAFDGTYTWEWRHVGTVDKS